MRNKLTVFVCYLLATFTLLRIIHAEPYKDPEITSLAVKDIIQLAESGHPYYQGVLSILYRTGDRGVSVSLEKAKEWAEKSSKGGSAIGTITLGSLEMQKNNLLEANQFYQDALQTRELFQLADDGDPVACFCLAELYMNSEPIDPALAVSYYQKAADLNYSNAKATLGSMYLQGSVVPRDTLAGIGLLEEAVAKGSAVAALNLGTAYALGDGVERNVGVARKYIKQAADQGLATAQLQLGKVLVDEPEEPNDIVVAKNYLEKAKDQYIEEADDILDSVSAIQKATESQTAMISNPVVPVLEIPTVVTPPSTTDTAPAEETGIQKEKEMVSQIPSAKEVVNQFKENELRLSNNATAKNKQVASIQLNPKAKPFFPKLPLSPEQKAPEQNIPIERSAIDYSRIKPLPLKIDKTVPALDSDSTTIRDTQIAQSQDDPLNASIITDNTLDNIDQIASIQQSQVSLAPSTKAEPVHKDVPKQWEQAPAPDLSPAIQAQPLVIPDSKSKQLAFVDSQLDAIISPKKPEISPAKAADIRTKLNLPLLKTKANKGNVSALLKLGDYYSYVENNDRLAQIWYLKATYKGNGIAQRKVGRLYFTGKGLPQDYGLAYRYFLAAAKNGDSVAQRYIAIMYYKGIGLGKNTDHAIRWFHVASRNGDNVSTNFLSLNG